MSKALFNKSNRQIRLLIVVQYEIVTQKQDTADYSHAQTWFV